MPSKHDKPNVMLRPTQEQRRLVSRPLGRLISEPRESIPTVLRERYLRSGARVSFSVGDAVTSTLIRGRIPFEVAVVDAKVRRKAVRVPDWVKDKVMRVDNPKGYLNPAALDTMRQALAMGGGTLVVVEGEEDLLTLFAIDLSKEGDLVVYGQPGEGVVVVKVDSEAKRRNSELLKSIPRVQAESN